MRRLRQELTARHGDLDAAFRAMDTDSDGVSRRRFLNYPRRLPILAAAASYIRRRGGVVRGQGCCRLRG